MESVERTLSNAEELQESKMNFLTYKDCIAENDTVIVYISPKKIFAIEIKPLVLNKNKQYVENIFQTIYGALHIRTLVGRRYGSKIFLKNGYLYVLHPTPELWTLSLPHRTQIIYTSDISIILFQLNLHPGNVVIEAGTGSGSLTHALARAVFPNGHVHTFEFHESRASIAQMEFSDHNLTELVSVHHRDVCSSGFGDLNCVSDAVFLDLPAPWLAVPLILNTYKSQGGRYVSFSPCVEQVQKTCKTLAKYGFQDIVTMECLRKEFNVSRRTLPGISYDEETPVTPVIEGINNGNIVAQDHSTSSFKRSETNKQIICLPLRKMTGHTGYITCATYPPVWARALKTNCNLKLADCVEDNMDSGSTHISNNVNCGNDNYNENDIVIH